MNVTIWKAYQTEKSALKYMTKLNNCGVKNITVEFCGGVYLVVSN